MVSEFRASASLSTDELLNSCLEEFVLSKECANRLSL